MLEIGRGCGRRGGGRRGAGGLERLVHNLVAWPCYSAYRKLELHDLYGVNAV